MNSRYYFLILILMMVSCHTASYTFTPDSMQYGLDYSVGTWYLNALNVPLGQKEKLTNMTINKFSNELGDRLLTENNDRYVSMFYLPLNPDKSLLLEAKRRVKCDYLINIESSTIKDELSEVEIGKIRGRKQNIVKVSLEVYDLNKLEIMFNKSIVARVTAQDENDDFQLITGEYQMTKRGLKKILNDL